MAVGVEHVGWRARHQCDGFRLLACHKMLKQKKLIYILAILVPVVYLPLRHSCVWLMLAFPAAFVLLSTGYNPVVELTFQYTARWTSYVFIASAWTLSSWLPRSDG